MTLSLEMNAAIELELKKQVSRVNEIPSFDRMHAMMAYHLGWEGEGAGPNVQGKRIRPLLTTLCTAASGGKWQRALPAAAGIELIHNFSLLHDDIEDSSPLRRGRPTIWKIWGIPQAINIGDAMFAMAHLAILDLDKSLPGENILACSEILQKTCLLLTQGQYLDIDHEDRNDLSLEDYWQMITGKTAALIACSCEMGALVGQCDDSSRQQYSRFGLYLGLAFQVMDDILGIWGDSQATGKSTQSDLATGKKTLPILYALRKQGVFYNRWNTGKVPPAEFDEAIHILVDEGAMAFSQEHAARLTNLALESLDNAGIVGLAGQELREITMKLLNRTY